MEKFAIMCFAGKYLEKNFTISPTALNHFIQKDETIGKTINDKEIADTLELMVECGWLEVERSDKINPIYRRYVTPYETKKFREGKRI